MIKSYKDTADDSECLPKLASDLQQEFGKIFQFILEIWRRSTLLENDNTVDHTNFFKNFIWEDLTTSPIRIIEKQEYYTTNIGLPWMFETILKILKQVILQELVLAYKNS